MINCHGFIYKGFVIDVDTDSLGDRVLYAIHDHLIGESVPMDRSRPLYPTKGCASIQEICDELNERLDRNDIVDIRWREEV